MVLLHCHDCEFGLPLLNKIQDTEGNVNTSFIISKTIQYVLVLWISGLPVAKCDPSLGRTIQQDPQSRPMDDPALEHDLTENMHILCW